MGKKVILVVAACAVAGGLGVFAGTRTWTGSGDAVQETAPRFQGGPSGYSAAAPRIPAESSSYFESLPEPQDGGGLLAGSVARQPKGALRAPASLVPGSAPVGKGVPPAEAALDLKAEAGGECALGARPMGDCDCYDEGQSRLSLRLHPTQSCLDEESRRLGHRVLVASEGGRYELAGVEPEPFPEALAAAAEANRSGAQLAVMNAGLVAAMKNVQAIQPAYFPNEALPAGGAGPNGKAAVMAAPMRMAMPVSVRPNLLAAVPAGHAMVAAPAAPAEAALLVVSRCGILGHEIHLYGPDGNTLHIRFGTALPAVLAHARDLVMNQGVGGLNIYRNRIEIWGNPGRVEQLSGSFSAVNYAGSPGFDDMATAMAYGASLNAQLAGNNPLAPPGAPGGRFAPGAPLVPGLPFGPGAQNNPNPPKPGRGPTAPKFKPSLVKLGPK